MKSLKFRLFIYNTMHWMSLTVARCTLSFVLVIYITVWGIILSAGGDYFQVFSWSEAVNYKSLPFALAVDIAAGGCRCAQTSVVICFMLWRRLFKVFVRRTCSLRRNDCVCLHLIKGASTQHSQIQTNRIPLEKNRNQLELTDNGTLLDICCV